VLDVQSTKWMTTYCDTLHPLTKLASLQKQVKAAGTDPAKVKPLIVGAFQTSGTALTATATKLKSAKAPTLTRFGSDLPGLLGKISALGATLTADGKKVAAVDPKKNPQGFVTAVQKYAPDLDKFASALGVGAGLKIPVAALPEIKRIPSCVGLITTA